VGLKREEVRGGATRDHERLEPLAGPNVEVALPGAAHGPRVGRCAEHERDEEVEPPVTEQRVWQKRCAWAPRSSISSDSSSFGPTEKDFSDA
jgi:hypothetical protein